MPIILVEPWTSAAFASPPSSSPRWSRRSRSPRRRRRRSASCIWTTSDPNAHDHPSRVNARAAMTAMAQASNGFFTVDLRTDPTGPRRRGARALRCARLLHVRRSAGRPSAAARRSSRSSPAARASSASTAAPTASIRGRSTATSSAPASSTTAARTCRGPSASRIRTTSRCRASPTRSPSPRSSTCSGARAPPSVDSFTRRDLHVLMNLDPATPDARAPRAAAAVPAAPGDRPPAGLDAPARRRPRVLFGLRPSAGDLGQPAVPRPRGRRDPLGAVRRRRRRPDDAWEQPWGLRDSTTRPALNGASSAIPTATAGRTPRSRPPDTHPRGFAQRYLAEGATSNFFETRIGVLNPSPTFTSRVQLRYQLDNGAVQTAQVTLAPRSRRTMITADRRRVLDAAGVGSARRRRPHDDLGPRRPLRQPRRVVARVPGARLVLRRRRDPRRSSTSSTWCRTRATRPPRSTPASCAGRSAPARP